MEEGGGEWEREPARARERERERGAYQLQDLARQDLGVRRLWLEEQGLMRAVWAARCHTALAEAQLAVEGRVREWWVRSLAPALCPLLLPSDMPEVGREGGIC